LRHLFVILYFFQLALLLGCKNHINPNEQECGCDLIVNGVREAFCGDPFYAKSLFEVGDEMSIVYNSTNCYDFAANNILRMNPGYADIKHSDTTSLYYYFLYTNELMKKNSQHEINLRTVGGFAFELWDNDTTYYSSEYGQQEAKIVIDDIKIHNPRPDELDPVINYSILTISSTRPIRLWDQNKTDFVILEIDSLEFTVDY
jgi:hypothetical protein